MNLLAVWVCLLFLLGCLTVPKAPPEENVSVVAEWGVDATGVGIDEIVIPEINESEGEFPLPV